jgi:hypothetical protein
MTVSFAAHFVNFIWYDIVLPIGFSPGLYGWMELYASSICRTRTILELFFLFKSCRTQARSQRFHLLTSWAIVFVMPPSWKRKQMALWGLYFLLF